LGRSNGDAFLSDLMLLPSPSTAVWPYQATYPARDDYEADVRPGRIELLRSEFLASRPSYVVCYGKGNWRHYEEIFNQFALRPEIEGRIRIAKHGHTTILLLPFFAFRYVTTALIEQIARSFDHEHVG